MRKLVIISIVILISNDVQGQTNRNLSSADKSSLYQGIIYSERNECTKANSHLNRFIASYKGRDENYWISKAESYLLPCDTSIVKYTNLEYTYRPDLPIRPIISDHEIMDDHEDEVHVIPNVDIIKDMYRNTFDYITSLTPEALYPLIEVEEQLSEENNSEMEDEEFVIADPAVIKDMYRGTFDQMISLDPEIAYSLIETTNNSEESYTDQSTVSDQTQGINKDEKGDNEPMVEHITNKEKGDNEPMVEHITNKEKGDNEPMVEHITNKEKGDNEPMVEHITNKEKGDNEPMVEHITNKEKGDNDPMVEHIVVPTDSDQTPKTNKDEKGENEPMLEHILVPTDSDQNQKTNKDEKGENEPMVEHIAFPIDSNQTQETDNIDWSVNAHKHHFKILFSIESSPSKEYLSLSNIGPVTNKKANANNYIYYIGFYSSKEKADAALVKVKAAGYPVARIMEFNQGSLEKEHLELDQKVAKEKVTKMNEPVKNALDKVKVKNDIEEIQKKPKAEIEEVIKSEVISYHILFRVLDNPYETFDDLKPIGPLYRETFDNKGNSRYLIGNTDKLDVAKILLGKVKEAGYKASFITEYRNGVLYKIIQE